DQAIKIDPKHDGPYYHRGMLRLTDGDYKGSLSDLSAFMKLHKKGDTWRKSAAASVAVIKTRLNEAKGLPPLIKNLSSLDAKTLCYRALDLSLTHWSSSVVSSP